MADRSTAGRVVRRRDRQERARPFVKHRGDQLDGAIPPEIGQLASLTFMRLSANRLSGGIPPEIGNLTNLSYLSLRLNRLVGRIRLNSGNSRT